MPDLRHLLALLVFTSLHVEFVHAGTPTVTLAASVSEVNEGTTFIITATLSEPVSFNASFPLAYSGSAGNGGDIDTRSTIFISAGQTTGTRSIRTNNDTVIEDTETVIISINSAPPGISIGDPASVAVDLLDDDLATSVSLSLAEAESDEGLPFLVIATLAEPINNDATIRWTWSGTATPSSDFLPGGRVVIIPAGETVGTRSIRTFDDTAIEPPETVIATLSQAGPNVSFGSPDSVTGTIIDDDLGTSVSLSVNTNQVEEGLSFEVIATLAEPINNDATIRWSWSGTATPNGDFLPGPTTVVIPAGETVGTRNVRTLDDTVAEVPETIVATLSTADPNVSFGDPDSVSVQILDNDSDPLADLAVDISSSGLVRFGGVVYWSILVDNLGPNEAVGARLVNDFPTTVSGVVWVCNGVDGGVCPSSGSDDIDALVDLPAGAAVAFSACAIAEVFEDGGFVTNSATVTPPPDTEDPNPANNSDTLTIGNLYLFADGFENAGPETICNTLLSP